MICRPCQTAADGVGCPLCGRPITHKSDGRIRYHKSKATGEECVGSHQWYVLGHLVCKGCSCHHKPRGSYRGQANSEALQ